MAAKVKPVAKAVTVAEVVREEQHAKPRGQVAVAQAAMAARAAMAAQVAEERVVLRTQFFS